MRRKFLSVVLCVCMMLTMAPFAFAEGETGIGETEIVTTNPPSSDSGSGAGSGFVTPTAGITTEDALKDAISAASDNATIKLDRDITLTSTLNITKNITLNGDGHTISGSVASGTSFIDVSIPNNGDFTLTNCKIVPTAQVTSNAAISLSVAGKVTVTDCTFGASSDTAGHMYNGLEFSQTVPMGDTTITGNTFYGGAFRHNCISFYKMNDNATININNNNFSNLNWDTTNAVRVSNYGSNTAIINLNDNTYSDHGTTGANQSYAGLLVFQKTASNNDNFTKLTVNINNFSTTSDSQLLYVYDDINNIITTNQPIIKGDSTISKFFSAKIDDVHYTTLPNAVEAAVSGDTITMLKDATVTTEIDFADKAITLDLNSKTVTGTLSAVTSVIEARGENGSLTLEDTSAEKAGKLLSNKYGISAAYGGKLTINSGTIESEYAALAGNNTAGDMNFEVNGGTLTSKQSEAIYMPGQVSLVVNDGTLNGGISTRMGQITINGGTINGMTGATDSIANYYHYSGSAWIGDAIYVLAGTYDSSNAEYTNSCNIKITGGTINGNNQYGVAVYKIGTGKEQTVNVNIEGGKFSGSKGAIFTISDGFTHSQNSNGKCPSGETTHIEANPSKVTTNISVSGGYFTTDPTAYIADNYAAKSSDKVGYAYMVAKKENNEVIVKPAVATPKVELGDQIVEAKKEAVTASAQSVKAPEIANAAAKNVSISSSQAKQYVDTANLTPSSGEEVILYVQSFLDVTPTAYNEEDCTYTLDITPKYQIVASTATTADQINLGANAAGKNAVVVKEATVLNVTEPTQVSLNLPADFVSKLTTGGVTSKVYVKHVKDNGKTYIYEATLNDNTLTFINPHGFSEFTITTTAPVATVDGIGYESLQDAVDAAANGATIVLNSGASHTLNLNTTKSVTVENKTGDKATITFNGTQKEIDNSSKETFSYTRPSSGSGSTSTTYDVKVNAATNGAVAADKKTASKGTTVTVTASPSKGYVVDAVKVVDKDGKDVAVTEKDGKYVFTMPASAVTVTGSFKAETPAPVALPFTDVKSGNWFYDAVKYAYAQGLMTGTSATTFAPNGTMNRAMIVTVLYRLEKSPAVTGASKFTDVPAGQWYSDAVAWAAANKIVNGYDETTFGPMNAVTREQMAAILFRYEQVKGLENVTLEENLNRFPDQNKISAYAIPALQWAVGQKIINGNADGTLDPTGTATRAQVAQIFTNLLNK